MQRRIAHLAGLALPVAGLFLLAGGGCNTQDAGESHALIAKQIEHPDELIGGPSSRGKLGDFLLANEKVRFIVTGDKPAYMGGVFGGTLIDADIVRGRHDELYGEGWDSFSETFPLVNLVETNPGLPGRDVALGADGLELVAVPSGVEVLKDGSDGEAIVRVSGRVGYVFEMLKFLDKDFLAGFLSEPIEFDGRPLEIDALLNLPPLFVNIYALLARLQTDFHFHNDYILREGDKYLTLRTTVRTAPPSDSALANCPEAPACDLECPDGFALEEVEHAIKGKAIKGRVMCPVCECAEPARTMETFNESEDLFGIILGDLDPWRDPAWKGGLVGGDFVFFGNETNIFLPGLGFDENRRVFENMWQEVPTLASPLAFDWAAAVAENVSYAWVSRNPDRKPGVECDKWRVALTWARYPDEDATVDVLIDELEMSEDTARSRTRQLIVEARPIDILDVKRPGSVGSETELAQWCDETLDSVEVECAGGEKKKVDSLFPEGVRVEMLPARKCQSSKLVVPIFTTSATAFMSHKIEGRLDTSGGAPRDLERTYTFERHLVVGDGDVGSLLETVYDLKGFSSGRVEGVVMDGQTAAPVSGASVFAIRDPRTEEAGEAAPETYDTLIARCREEFGHDGFASHMKTDPGLDPLRDGRYAGPLPPGSYFLVAFTRERGPSVPVPLEVEAGKRAVAHLALPPAGRVAYLVRDQGGLALPSRLTFIPRNEEGVPERWDALSRVELGGSRYDDGIYEVVHSESGSGTVSLPAGVYEVYVSRGMEYGLHHDPAFEVRAGAEVFLDVMLFHELDTTGWISGDFHVHAKPSIDSGLPLLDRVRAFVAEGVEFLTSTDHDFLTDYAPYIRELGLEHLARSAVGVETTTLEFGHYNGFPLEYDHTELPVHGAPSWYGRPLAEVFASLRALVDDAVDPEDFVVQINHPRDGVSGYFSAFGLKGWDLERDTPGTSMCNPQTQTVSCDFDSVELINEKRLELVRTPTVGETHMHNVCLNAIFAASSCDDFDLDPAAPEASACGTLRLDPDPRCAGIEAELATTDATGLELAALHSLRDHCAWHESFDAALATCDDWDDFISAKHAALDALKLLTVRYILERTPEEQQAFYATTAATDIGCDMEKAMTGCAPNLADDGTAVAGCGGEADCFCEACVCAALPECCQAPADGGTGWTQACADHCRGQCHGCGVQPCTSHQAPFEDWFSFWDHGLEVTAVANSDSHDLKREVGWPRNWIVSGADEPRAISPQEVFRNIKAHRVIGSTGPFVEFSIAGAGIGEVASAPAGATLPLRIRIQTASWFGVDHVEIFRNSNLEQVIRIAPAPETLVDFDATVDMPMPAEDSWYVVVAYGLDEQYIQNPVYKRIQLGVMLIPSVIAMGAKSILASFPGLLEEAGPLLAGLGMDLDTLITGALGSSELPDVNPMLPFAFTNPIRVDVDGDGYRPPRAIDADGDGEWDLPPFCSRPCQVDAADGPDGQPVYGQSGCGMGQTCLPSMPGPGGVGGEPPFSDVGVCSIPIPPTCVGPQVPQE